MPSIVVIAKLLTAGGDARQSVIDALDKVSKYSKANEPGVLRYMLTVPRDSLDDKSVYVFEEYADQAALDAHMGTKATADLIAYFGTNSSLFSGSPDIATCETSSSFARPECATATDPYIAYASIDYKEGTRDEALQGWKYVTSETQNNEPDTLGYGILKDKANTITINSVELYANETYFREVHAKSKAVQDNRAKYGEQVRTAFRLALLKHVAGYLHR
ncbi:hypothetical protein CC78DRAFT_568364, partial [Lojkania enalia]